MMPFLSFPLSFSSVYLSCQNSRSFWMLSDTWCGLGCPVQGQGWTLRIPWIPSSSGHSLCCPFNSHQLCLLCFPRQTKEVRPSKVWISSRWELWPCRHSWIAQTPEEKISPISSREWNTKVFAKTWIEFGNLPLSTLSWGWEFHRDKTSPPINPKMNSVTATGCPLNVIFYFFSDCFYN